MGLFIDFFKDEYIDDKKFYKNLSKNIFNYFNSRQVAENQNLQKKSFNKSIKYYSNILNLKKNNLIKKKRIQKFLFVDNSSLS